MRTAGEPLPQASEDVRRFGSGLRTPYERDSAIDEVFTRAAQTWPKAPAIVGRRGSLTYDEVERGSNRIANALLSRGVIPGAAVGVAFERCTNLPLVLLAILKAGAAYVPIDRSYPIERIKWMIDDASICLVITHDEPSSPEIPVRHVSVDELLDFDNDQRPVQKSSCSSLAYVMYTSGSTGRPKGVAVEHRSVVRLVRGTDYLSIQPDDAFLHFAPLSFDASTFEIWAPLLNGARLAVPSAGLASIDELTETIDRFGVTTMFLTTALFQRLVDVASAPLASLRTLLTGGEVASPAHMARFLQSVPHCRLVAVYGPTENTTFSTWCDVSSSHTLGAIPIGKPVANSTAFVLDDALQPLPVGVEGELCVGGDGVARGYVNRPDLADRFVSDPFSTGSASRLYRTGDRARWRSDGVLEFLGRDDDQVKVRGFRIELGEIEAALQKHEAIGAAAVVVVARRNEKELVANVVFRPGNFVDVGALRAWLGRKLPLFMIPHRIVVRSALPLTPSGKLDRNALAKSSAELTRLPATDGGSAMKVKYSESERAIAQIWGDILRCEVSPGLDDNFFDAGGDSLRLLAVHSRLREQLGVDVSVTDLFVHCTIRKLANLIATLPVRA